MATTIEKLGVCLQATTILLNVRRDLKREASVMLNRINTGEWTEEFAADAITKTQGFADRVLRTLDRITNNKTLVEEAMSDLGVSLSEVRSDFVDLKNAAQNLKDNTTSTNVVSVLTTLSAIPDRKRLF